MRANGEPIGILLAGQDGRFKIRAEIIGWGTGNGFGPDTGQVNVTARDVVTGKLSGVRTMWVSTDRVDYVTFYPYDFVY